MSAVDSVRFYTQANKSTDLHAKAILELDARLSALETPTRMCSEVDETAARLDIEIPPMPEPCFASTGYENRDGSEIITVSRKAMEELAEAANAYEKDKARLHEMVRSFISTVLTVKRENQPEWMEYLAEQINEVCEVIGEEDRVAYRPSHEAILPIKK